MAAVYRGVPPIVIPESKTSDIEGMELKDDGGTKEDLYGMAAKSEEERATQAGECHMRRKGSVLRCHTEEEQGSLCKMKEKAKKTRQYQREEEQHDYIIEDSEQGI